MFKQVRLHDAILKFYQRSQPIAFSNAETLYEDLILLRDQIIMYGDLSEAQTNYLNEFIEQFDTTLSVTVRDIFEKWLVDGFLVDLIRDIINEEVVEARDGEARLNLRLDRDKQDNDDKNNELTTRLTQLSLNVKTFGAKGDGVTDDTVAIQNALDLAYQNGGGVVYIPTGHYITSKSLRVRDNVEIKGNGYSSWIENIREVGYERCVILTGNIGDITSKESVYDEPRFPLQAISKGADKVTLRSASNLEVGDIVFIFSKETWTTTFPDSMVPVYQSMNKIVKKEETVITLKHTLRDDFVNPTIAKFSGTVMGYDGEPAWIAENAKVNNLRITHRTGQVSGWYCLFGYGFECEFSNLYMDDCSTMIATNATGYSIFKDITGRFDGGAIDMADMSVNNKFIRIKGERMGMSTHVNLMGVSNHDGCDVSYEDCYFDFGGMGHFSSLYHHRFKMRDVSILNPNSPSLSTAVYGCQGDGFYGDNITVSGGSQNGILVVGSKSTLINSRVLNENHSELHTAIRILASVKDSIFSGNVMGEVGNRTRYDVIAQTNGFKESNVFRDNVGYDTQPTHVDKAFSVVNTLTDSVLKSVEIKATAHSKSRITKILCSGSRAGANGTKKVKLNIGDETITTINYPSAGGERWFIEVIISTDDIDSSPRIYYNAMLGATMVSRNVVQKASLLDTHKTLSVMGSVENIEDSITCDLLILTVE